SGHVSDPALESTRRRLTAKQADTVDRLGRAAVELLCRAGFAGLTVRRVAASPAAAHESAEPAARVCEVLRHIAMLVADEPEFAGAVTNALLGKEPDVEVLRQRIGRDIRDRLAAALGPDTDPDVIDSLEMLYSGALVRAGMGYASYADIAQRLEKSARLMLR